MPYNEHFTSGPRGPASQRCLETPMLPAAPTCSLRPPRPLSVLGPSPLLPAALARPAAGLGRPGAALRGTRLSRGTRADQDGKGTARVAAGSSTGHAKLSTPQASHPRSAPPPLRLQAAPAPRLHRLAHPPPLGNFNPGRGGREAASAPAPPDLRSPAPAWPL